VVSPEDQPTTFVELFFDLVFVFGITQIVGLLHHDLSWGTVGEAVLIFWLLWWAWTQFTWALNAANTEHPGVELATLVATAIAFVMAIALPDAFHGKALWFAGPYVAVRIVGLLIYAEVAWANDPEHHASVRTFGAVSAAGLLCALTGAAAGGAAQYWLWGLTIVLDVVAALVGGRASRWDLHPEHFSERHGLFVIIALGETLIVAAAGLTGVEWTGPMIGVALAAVGTTCALWWSYFPGARPALERGLAETPAARQARTARDAFSLVHFPMLCGVVGYALAVEEAVAHPTTPLPLEARAALALGVLLFVGGAALAVRRATGRLLGLRIVASAATAGLLLGLAEVPPVLSLVLAFGGIAGIVALERWPEVEPGGGAV